MRRVFTLAALAGLSGCGTIGPLDEGERARVHTIVPVAAQFAPKVEFKVPPGKAGGAATAATAGAGAAAYWSLICGPFWGTCFAVLAPVGIAAGAAAGAVVTPSREQGIESRIERARSRFGASDAQRLLLKRFSERVARLTPHSIDLSAGAHGPRSPGDAPDYSRAAAGEGALVAELAVETVSGDLSGSERRLMLELRARMRLVRPSDGVTLMTRTYRVARAGRFMQEYEHDETLLLGAIAGAVDEVATHMVDSAFLLRYEEVGAQASPGVATEALDALSSGRCFKPAHDCWMFRRVPTLDSASPTFRWRPFPEPGHVEATPWLRSARNLVYDLWVFGGEDDRVVEGLKTTDHTLERPLPDCMRYLWAVRARFDTDAGPRAVRWSMPAPFFTPCFAKTS